ncbi:MAG: branched-chain amino acid ABC transporter permease [Halobacteria archaeon]
MKLLSDDTVRDVVEFGDKHALKILTILVVVAGALPVLGLLNSYMVTVGLQLFMFGVLALSWDLIGGQTGYPSFGNMVFFGVGAYLSAIMVGSFGVAVPLAFAGSLLGSVMLSLAVGAVLLQRHGGYFGIATLGVLLVAQQVTMNLGITGGASGLTVFESPSDTQTYYLFLSLLVTEVVLVRYLMNTRFGFILNAICDDEEKVKAMGVNTTVYKTSAWVLSASFTGLAGGIWALYNSFLDPQSAFNLEWNVEIIAMALLGGSGSVAGPVLGAFGLKSVIFAVTTYFTGWNLVVLGLVIITVVIKLPDGVYGTVRRRATKFEYFDSGGDSAYKGGELD